MKTILVITARAESSRIKKKPFIKIDSIYLLDLLMDIALGLDCVDEVLLTSESQILLDFFERPRVRSVLTSSSVNSGTERVAEICRLDGYPQGVNYAILPCDIWLSSSKILKDFILDCLAIKAECATLVRPISVSSSLDTLSDVKVLHDNAMTALFFFRSCPLKLTVYQNISQQLGVYFYSSSALRAFNEFASTEIEILDNNESFRFLLNGWGMKCIPTEQTLKSINTSEDIFYLEQEFGFAIENGFCDVVASS